MDGLEREGLRGLYVTPTLKDQFKVLAAQERRTMNQLATEALKLYLDMKAGNVVVVSKTNTAEVN